MGGCNAGGGEVPSGNDDRSGDSEPVGTLFAMTEMTPASRPTHPC